MANYVSFDYITCSESFEDVCKLGGNAQFTVTATLDDNTNTIVDNKDIIWKLSPENVGYVTGDGRVYIMRDPGIDTSKTPPVPKDITLRAIYKYDTTLNVQFPSSDSLTKWKINKNVERVDIVTLPDIKNKYQSTKNDPTNEQDFKGIIVYDDGSYKKADNNVDWSSNDTSIISAIPKQVNSETVGRILPRDEGNAKLTLSYTLDPNIKDSIQWKTHKSVVRLKINETPNEELKKRMGKQTFTVTKIYDTGKEELVTGEDMNNLEWTITPPGAAFVDATTGEAISWNTSNALYKGIYNDDDSLLQVRNNEMPEYDSDVTLTVNWRGKNGEIDYDVEPDQVHWRIQKKIIGIKILGFDKEIEANTFSKAPAYAVKEFNGRPGIRKIHGEQEFRAIFTYDDGTTTPTIINKSWWEGQEALAASGRIEVLGSTDLKDQEYIDNRSFIDVAGETNDIIWTLQYIYNRDDGSEYAIDWKDNWEQDENELNKIADLYVYPFIDIIPILKGQEALAASGKIQKYWCINDENKDTYALIAHITALKAGKCRLYCTYINDKSIYDWIDFEVEKEIESIAINELPNDIVREIGGSQTFTVTAYYNDGSSELLTDTDVVSWSLLSDGSVANIDDYGTVTIKTKGSVQIRARAKNFDSDIVTWDINKDLDPITPLKIIPVPAINLAIGDSTVFEGLWIYNDGSNSPVSKGVWGVTTGEIIDEWVENGYYRCRVKNTAEDSHGLSLRGEKGSIVLETQTVWSPVPVVKSIELEPYPTNPSSVTDPVNSKGSYRIKVTYNDDDNTVSYLSDLTNSNVEVI